MENKDSIIKQISFIEKEIVDQLNLDYKFINAYNYENLIFDIEGTEKLMLNEVNKEVRDLEKLLLLIREYNKEDTNLAYLIELYKKLINNCFVKKLINKDKTKKEIKEEKNNILRLEYLEELKIIDKIIDSLIEVLTNTENEIKKLYYNSPYYRSIQYYEVLFETTNKDIKKLKGYKEVLNRVKNSKDLDELSLLVDVMLSDKLIRKAYKNYNKEIKNGRNR